MPSAHVFSYDFTTIKLAISGFQCIKCGFQNLLSGYQSFKRTTTPPSKKSSKPIELSNLPTIHHHTSKSTCFLFSARNKDGAMVAMASKFWGRDSKRWASGQDKDRHNVEWKHFERSSLFMLLETNKQIVLLVCLHYLWAVCLYCWCSCSCCCCWFWHWILTLILILMSMLRLLFCCWWQYWRSPMLIVCLFVCLLACLLVRLFVWLKFVFAFLLLWLLLLAILA